MSALLLIEQLPDGVRYVLPRRRRGGWWPLLKRAALAFFLYAVVAFFSIGLAVNVGRVWIAPVALVAVLVLLLGGIFSIRSAWKILTAPDVELALLPGRLEVHRHSLIGGATTATVPLVAVRRFVVQSLAEPTTAAPPQPGVKTGLRRVWQIWFGPSAEQQRADERQAALQRFFGTLVLEGDDDAAVLLAEGCSLAYLRALATDLAARCAAEGRTVAVLADAVTPIADDDPRLQRPVGVNSQAEKSADGVTIVLPAVGLDWSAAVIVIVLIVVGVFVLGPALPSAVTAVEVVGVGLVLLWIGIPFLRGIYDSGNLLLARLQRTVVTVEKDMLCVRADWRLWQRQRCWSTMRIATVTVIERGDNANKKTKQPKFLHDLVLLDHGMAQTRLVPARSEAELDWVAAVLHKELGLGL